MPKPDEPFTRADLSDLLRVNEALIDAWHASGVGPESFEQQTPAGVKRLYSAEAVRAFVNAHRVAPGAQNPRDPSPPLFGGQFTANP